MNLRRIAVLASSLASFALASCTGVGAVAEDASADDAPRTVRVLFIGNSFTEFNDLPHVVARLADTPDAPVHFEVGQYTPGGQSWQGHDADPRVDDLIHAGWDYVVLQDQSAQPFWDLPEVKAALLSLDAEIRATSARTVLFMTWARADGGFYEHMRVNSYYVHASEPTGALVAPVGRAWERALRDPSVTLHAEDGSHPNVRGTYLAACVFYATLTGASPVGLGDGGLAVSDEEAAYLQRAAWESIVARQAVTPPAARWSLARSEDLVPAGELDFGDALGPDGMAGSATRFTDNACAGVPYFMGMNTPELTVSLAVQRADWSQPTEHAEHLVGRAGIYSIALSGTTLEAAVVTEVTASTPALTPIGPEPAPVLTHLTFAAEGLSPGWHRITFTHDALMDRLYVDGAPVASVATAGMVCGATRAGCDSGMVLGAESDILGTAAERVPELGFSGALADLRVFGAALTAAQIRAL